MSRPPSTFLAISDSKGNLLPLWWNTPISASILQSEVVVEIAPNTAINRGRDANGDEFILP